uniref:Uncharacterized protein n=1 Tax=Plectus sambesii TaxID=2011161 RepID=A0A914UYB1_9BILA
MPGPETAAIQRKIALMGYPCVGKSSLTLRFVQGHFPDAYDTTIEDLHTKLFKFQGKPYDLQVIDTAGQQEYSLFPRSCALDVHGYILVYAIDDRKTFEIIQTIHDKIMENVGETSVPLVLVGNKLDLQHSSRVPLVLVGNKLDLQHSSRSVSTEEGKKLANAWKAAFIETSAKDNTAVQTIFEHMLYEIESAAGNIQPTKKKECRVM